MQLLWSLLHAVLWYIDGKEAGDWEGVSILKLLTQVMYSSALIVAFGRRPCFLQVLPKHFDEVTLSSPIHLNAVALEHPEPKNAGKT